MLIIGVLKARIMTPLPISNIKNSFLQPDQEIYYHDKAIEKRALTIEAKDDPILQDNSDQFVKHTVWDDLDAQLRSLVIHPKTFEYLISTHYEDRRKRTWILKSKDLPQVTPLNEVASGHIAHGDEHWYKVQVRGQGAFSFDAEGSPQTRRNVIIAETTGTANLMLFAYNESLELFKFSSSDDGREKLRLEIPLKPDSIYYFKVVSWFDSSGEYTITVRQE